MAVYFKFKSAQGSNSVSLDGPSISVSNLKQLIVAKKKLGKGKDFDLVISDALSNEEYTDEQHLVPKNTSVLVRRIPRPSLPIVVDRGKSDLKTSTTPRENIQRSPVFDDLDDFGGDLYAAPEVVQAPVQSLSENEDEKIRALVEASTLEWQQPEEPVAEKGYGTKGPGRSFREGLEKKIPPRGYVCHRCGVAGHFIQHCPTNADPAYDRKKVRPPTGIPRSMLDVDLEGTYFLPTGQVAVLKPNESAFEREVDFLPSSAQQIVDIPPELRCPVCKEVLKDAVLTSKCCFRSYCDKCIRNEIITKGKCVCGATNVLADGLLPNKTLRDAIDRLLESPQVSSITSSDNAGNRAYALEISRAQTQATPSVKQRMEVDDDSVESGTSKEECVQEEIVSSKKPVEVEAELREQGLNVPEPVIGKKKPKSKHVRQEETVHPGSVFRHGPNSNNSHFQDYCMHCGSYEHLSWNCYLVNDPVTFHHQPVTQGSYGPGFGPELMGTMSLAMGGGYPMRSHHYPGLYSGYKHSQFQFNGPWFPSYEPVVPHGGMMAYGQFEEGNRQILKRRREMEQSFAGREETTGYDSQVKRIKSTVNRIHEK